MKKIFIIILTFVSLLTVIGCSKKTEVPTKLYQLVTKERINNIDKENPASLEFTLYGYGASLTADKETEDKTEYQKLLNYLLNLEVESKRIVVDPVDYPDFQIVIHYDEENSDFLDFNGNIYYHYHDDICEEYTLANYDELYNYVYQTLAERMDFDVDYLVLFDVNDIKVELGKHGVKSNSYYLECKFTNDSDEDVSIRYSKIFINGYEIVGNVSLQVYAGQTVSYNISLDNKALYNYGINTICNVKIAFSLSHFDNVTFEEGECFYQSPLMTIYNNEGVSEKVSTDNRKIFENDEILVCAILNEEEEQFAFLNLYFLNKTDKNININFGRMITNDNPPSYGSAYDFVLSKNAEVFEKIDVKNYNLQTYQDSYVLEFFKINQFEFELIINDVVNHISLNY